MEWLGTIIVVIGGVASAGAGIWFIVRAFQVSIGWGLACLLLPIVDIFFLIIHWEKARQPFLLGLAGAATLWIGTAIAGT